MPYLGIFGLDFEKGVVIFEIIFLTAKFCAAMKILKLRTKNALF